MVEVTQQRPVRGRSLQQAIKDEAEENGGAIEEAPPMVDRAAMLAYIRGREKFDDDDLAIIDGFFEKASDDDTKKIKHFNGRLASFQDRLKNETQAEFERRRESDVNLSKWGTFFDGLSPQQFRDITTNDAAAMAMSAGKFTAKQYRDAHGAVQERNSELGISGGGDANVIAQRMLSGLREAFQAADDTKDLADDFEKLVTEHASDAGRLYREVGDLAIKGRRKKMEQDFDSKFEALRQELLADRHANAKDGPGVIPGQVSGNAPMTLDQYHQLSSAERRAMPAEAKDAMVAAEMAARR